MLSCNFLRIILSISKCSSFMSVDLTTILTSSSSTILFFMLFKQQYRRLVKTSNEWVDSVRETRLVSNGRAKSQKENVRRTKSIGECSGNKVRSTNTIYLTSTRVRTPSRNGPQLDQLLKLINCNDIDKCKINYENLYMNCKKSVKPATYKCLESLKILNFDKINEDEEEQSLGGTKKYMENFKMPSSKNMRQPEMSSNAISSVVKLKKFANKKRNLTFHENVKNSQGKIGLNFVWRMQLGGRRQAYAYFKQLLVKIEGAKTYTCQVMIRYQMLGIDKAFAFKKISGLEAQWVEYMIATNNFQKLSMIMAIFGQMGQPNHHPTMLSSAASKAFTTSINTDTHWPATPTFSPPPFQPNIFSPTSLRSFMKTFFIRPQIRFSFKQSPNSSINSANIFQSYYQVIKTKQQYSIQRRASVKFSATDLTQPIQEAPKSEQKLNIVKSQAPKNSYIVYPITHHEVQQNFLKLHNQYLYNYQKNLIFHHKLLFYHVTMEDIRIIDSIRQTVIRMKPQNEWTKQAMIIMKMLDTFGKHLMHMMCQRETMKQLKIIKRIDKQRYTVQMKWKEFQKKIQIGFRKVETRALRHRYEYSMEEIDKAYISEGGDRGSGLVEKMDYLLNRLIFSQQLTYTSVSLRSSLVAFSRKTPNIKIHRTNHYMVHTNIQNLSSSKSYLLIYLPKTQKTFMKLENINLFQKDFHDCVPQQLLTVQFKRSIIKSNNSYKQFGSTVSLKKRKNVIIRRDGLRSGPIRHSLMPMEKRARDNGIFKQVGPYCITCYISRQPSIESDAHMDAKLFIEVSRLGTLMYICCSGSLIEVVRNMKIEVPRDRIVNSVRFAKEVVEKVKNIVQGYEGTMRNLGTILKEMVEKNPKKEKRYRMSRGSRTLTFIQGENLRIFNEQREIKHFGSIHDRIDQTIDVLKKVKKTQSRRRLYRRLYNFYSWCREVGYNQQ